MIRAAALLIVLAGLISPALAKGNATLAFVPYGAIKCPYSVDNGCAGSVVGQPGSAAVRYTTGRQPGGMLNQLTGLTLDYSSTIPAINYPGVDYWVGEPFPLSFLKDPTNPANLPSGCTLAPTAGPGANPTITCNVTGTNNLTFDSFDMTAGGTTCIALGITGTSTGTATVTNNYWKNNGNCSAGIFAQEMFVAVGMTGGNLIFEYNTLDGNGVNFPYDYGSCPPPTGTSLPNCNPSVAYLIAGGATVEYNAIVGFTGRTLQYESLNVTKGLVFQYNLLQGCCSSNPAAHGELEEYLSNPGGAGETYDSNTVMVTTSHHVSGQAAFPTQFTTANAIPVFDVSNNLYLPGLAGGGSVTATAAGSMSGNIFTTSSITVGNLGSGALVVCGTTPNQVTGVLVYDGTNTGVVSAGPGGGGNSNGNTITTWPMTWGASAVQASLDNGSGGSGNTLTVTTDLTLTLQIGTGVAISGSRFITAMSPSTDPDTGLAYTGTGTTGTYGVGGAAATVAVGTVSVSPDNIFPGGWGVPGTLACASAAHPGGPFTRAIADETTPGGPSPGPMGQVTHVGNYADLTAYGPGGISGLIWNQRTNSETFYGSIAGSNLTLSPAVRSTTVTAQGTGYTSATVTYGSGCTFQNPTGTASVSGGLVTGITQTQAGIGCASTPSVTIGGPGTGATATANVTLSSAALVLGQYLLDNSTVAAGTILQSGTTPNYVVSGSQTLALSNVLMTATQTYCTNPTIWGSAVGNPNVDMAGIYNSASMNAYNVAANVPGNGCQ